jgi:hypothetical protein
MFDPNTTLDPTTAPAVDACPGHLSSAPDIARDVARDVARDAPGEPDREARRLAHDVVARFVRDPAAFAEAARADSPSAFLQDYRQGVDRRLTALVGAPRKTTDRLATMGAPVVIPPGDWLPKTPGEPHPEQPDHAPRMGALAVVVAAAAVVSALAAVASAAAALGLVRHKPL